MIDLICESKFEQKWSGKPTNLLSWFFLKKEEEGMEGREGKNERKKELKKERKGNEDKRRRRSFEEK